MLVHDDAAYIGTLIMISPALSFGLGAPEL